MLEVADIVRVSATIRPRGVLRKELGRTLFITTDEHVPASGAGKVMTFARFSDVADIFPAESEPFKAAQVYFAQSPLPRNLLIGRWAKELAPTVVRGGAPAPLEELRLVTNGVFRFNGEDYTNINFANASSYNSIATALRTKFLGSTNAANAMAVVAYSASPQRFVVSFAEGPALESGFGESDASGTELAGLLGLDTASGARLFLGGAAEGIADAMTKIVALDNSFYFIVIEAGENDTEPIAELSSWAGANAVMFSAETNAAGVLTTQDSATLAARISLLESPRTFMTWSATPDYKALSIAARFSSVNFNSPGSLITGKFKTLPGTLADEVSATAKQELDRKRINHYSPYGGDNIFAEGWTLQSGTWIDVRYWMDWFINAVQSDVYNLLRSSNRVPQTIPGIASIADVVEGVCRQGVRNGGIAPGTVSAGMAADIRHATGDDDFDGALSTGYLVHVGSLAEQAQSERERRVSPPLNIYIKGSGAVHFVEIDLIFEN